MALFGNVVGSTRNFTLTADFLKKYDVIILQALEDSEYTGFWTFTGDEVSALSDWVNKGGGLITMSGYGSQSQEVDPVNQLLAPFGISYNRARIFSFRATVPTICATVPTGRFRLAVGIPRTARWSTILIRRTAKWVSSWAAPSLAPIARSWARGRPIPWLAFTNRSALAGLRLGRRVGHLHQPVERRFDLPGPSPVRELHADKIYNIPQFWYNVFRWVAGDGSSCFQMADTTVIQR